MQQTERKKGKKKEKKRKEKKEKKKVLYNRIAQSVERMAGKYRTSAKVFPFILALPVSSGHRRLLFSFLSATFTAQGSTMMSMVTLEMRGRKLAKITLDQGLS